jgi:hypothetical protein
LDGCAFVFLAAHSGHTGAVHNRPKVLSGVFQMNQQHVGHDFLSSRIEADIPKSRVPTITFLARECPVCKKLTRTLVRPSQTELQCEIGVECGCQGDTRYPSAYVSFQGSFVRNDHIIVETLRGSDGAPGVPGPPGRDAAPPNKQELKALLAEVLQEHLDKQRANRFWRKFAILRRERVSEMDE